MALLKQCKRCGVLIHRPVTRHSKICESCKLKSNQAKHRQGITNDKWVEIRRNNMEATRFYKSAVGRKFVASAFKTRIASLKKFISLSQKYLDTHRSVDLEYKAYLEMKINAAKQRLGLILEPLDKSTGHSE